MTSRIDPEDYTDVSSVLRETAVALRTLLPEELVSTREEYADLLDSLAVEVDKAFNKIVIERNKVTLRGLRG